MLGITVSAVNVSVTVKTMNHLLCVWPVGVWLAVKPLNVSILIAEDGICEPAFTGEHVIRP